MKGQRIFKQKEQANPRNQLSEISNFPERMQNNDNEDDPGSQKKNEEDTKICSY